jgi:hypothetical protein
MKPYRSSAGPSEAASMQLRVTEWRAACNKKLMARLTLGAKDLPFQHTTFDALRCRV